MMSQPVKVDQQFGKTDLLLAIDLLRFVTCPL